MSAHKVVRETITNGTTTRMFDFIYDESGRPFAVKYTINGTTSAMFYYVLNLQGDVVKIIAENGTVMANYSYNAWGEILSITNASGTAITASGHLANLNPIRYRGYYYDTETGFYYLQSRYYDPTMHRFINADSLASTGQGFLGYNMFAYCDNNPTNKEDPTGHWGWVIGVIGVIVTLLTGCTDEDEPGPPPDYVQENSKKQNCYSYAFDLPAAANPGMYSITESASDYMFKNKSIYSTKEITDFILRDMAALNKSVRVVNSPDDKLDGEYIVAMKTSTTILSSIGVADYHFAVMLSDGTWADKPGQTPSRWNVINGVATHWDLGNIKKYYNTDTVYFAVKGAWK